MKAKISWNDAVSFTAVPDSGHRVGIDGPLDIGGKEAGIRPMELMLMGVGGCAAVDVVHILRKGRSDINGCDVEITAERAVDDPHVFTDIHLLFRVAGENVSEQKLARAIRLSAEKYCSASILMKRAGVRLTYDYEVVQCV